jgi:hypothetical protein
MGLHIARGGQFGFIAVVLAGMFATTPAAAQSLSDGRFTGAFFVSLPDSTITAHGVGHASGIGRARFELNLSMTPTPISPFVREFTGELILTSPSGDELYLDITFGDLIYDPNAGEIFTPDSFVIEVRGGTGRFASASGTGSGHFDAILDDSGVAGILRLGYLVGIRLH